MVETISYFENELTEQGVSRPYFGNWLLVLGILHTLQTLLFGAVQGLDLYLLLGHAHYSSQTLLAILLGYSLFGFPFILLGLSLNALELSQVSIRPATLCLIAAGLALIALLAVVVQPYSVFWLGLLIALKLLLAAAPNKHRI